MVLAVPLQWLPVNNCVATLLIFSRTRLSLPPRRYMQMWQAALCGMIIKLDHSFKVVKRVRDATAHKQFSAVLTVMNEFCQVWQPLRAKLVPLSRKSLC